MSGQLQTGRLYRVTSVPGMAFRFVGQATYLDEWTGEEVEHDMVHMVAVGDDHVWAVDPDDVVELDVERVCECGQLGCEWGAA